MTIKDKKEELYRLIEQSDNERLINYLYSIIKEEGNDEMEWTKLTPDFREELLKRYEYIKDASSDYVKNEVVFEKYNAWLSK